MLKFVSWNINGYSKFSNFPVDYNFVTDSAGFCTQETFDYEDQFSITGFTKFATAATRTAGRGSRGLATFISNAKLGNCSQQLVPSELDWVLPVFLRDVESGWSLLLLNVYAPRYARS